MNAPALTHHKMGVFALNHDNWHGLLALAGGSLAGSHDLLWHMVHTALDCGLSKAEADLGLQPDDAPAVALTVDHLAPRVVARMCALADGARDMARHASFVGMLNDLLALGLPIATARGLAIDKLDISGATVTPIAADSATTTAAL